MPAEPVFRALYVECVVIVRHRDHERLDEGFLALVDGVGDDRLGSVLRRGTDLGDGCGQLDGLPFACAVDQFADTVLQGVVAGRERFADEDFRIGRQRAAPSNRALHRVDHVIAVQHRLSGVQRPGIEVGLRAALVDSSDLVGKRRDGALAVVDAGKAQDGVGHLCLGADQVLHLLLGPGVFPARIEGGLLVDPFARILRLVHQHGAGVDEPLDLEALQRVQQVARAFHVHLIVLRAGLPGKVEEGDKVDYRCNFAPMLVADLLERGLHRLRRRYVDLDDGRAILMVLGAIQPHHGKIPGKGLAQ